MEGAVDSFGVVGGKATDGSCKEVVFEDEVVQGKLDALLQHLLKTLEVQRATLPYGKLYETGRS